MRTGVRTVLVVGVLVLGVAPPAAADGPGVGTPTVVTLGDSAISGEAAAGRATRTSRPRASTRSARPPTGTRATGEAIRGCHRSKAAQAHIGGGVDEPQPRLLGREDDDRRHRLGRRTSSPASTSTPTRRPQGPGARAAGVREDAQRPRGRADDRREQLRLRGGRRALRDELGDLAVVAEELLQRRLRHDLALHRRRVRRPRRPTCATRSCASRRRCGTPATPRRSTRSSRQTYWSPIPRGSGFRYPETGWTRQSIGGCGTWNRDADWANDTVVTAMNNSVKNGAAAAGLHQRGHARPRRLARRPAAVRERRRRCSRRPAPRRGRAPGAVDRSEWVAQIRTVTTIVGPYQLQESGHASYWGQLAMRNCLRQAYNGGAVRGGKCVRAANGLNAQGEPKMALQ